MKAFLTGATGFIGGHVARRLRQRGDEVTALVRSPERAGDLRDLGCQLVQGGVTDAAAVRRAAEGCDAAFHIAAVYKVGIPKSERPAMYEANVTGTERVLDACSEAGVEKIVYVSTCAVFGDTGGEVVDETFARDTSKGFTSYYDETKYLSHEVARDRIAKGAPVVIVQPGGVYGPDDHSDIGTIIDQTAAGKLPAITFGEMGIMLAHVEDIADGILLAHDRGRIGEAYVLSAEKARMKELIHRVAGLAGRKPPRFDMPTSLIRMSAPLGPVIGPMMGFGPNLGELVRTSDGVTYWASDAKARRELGWTPRDLDTGLRETIGA